MNVVAHGRAPAELSGGIKHRRRNAYSILKIFIHFISERPCKPRPLAKWPPNRVVDVWTLNNCRLSFSHYDIQQNRHIRYHSLDSLRQATRDYVYDIQ